MDNNCLKNILYSKLKQLVGRKKAFKIKAIMENNKSFYVTYESFINKNEVEINNIITVSAKRKREVINIRKYQKVDNIYDIYELMYRYRTLYTINVIITDSQLKKDSRGIEYLSKTYYIRKP